MIRTTIGGMALACVVATLLTFYYAGVSKVSPRTSASHERVPSRALPTPVLSR